MGAIIPSQVESTSTKRYLAKVGVRPRYVGKVRHTYPCPGRPDLLLVETTDRLSIFDFVLAVFVPYKGEVLTALTHFWLTHILGEFPHHLVPSQKSPLLNAAHDLKKNLPRLALERCLVIRKMEIPPYEMIFRRHLGGSVFAKYLETGLVAGVPYPMSIPKWGYLERAAFTPSTKEVSGHDVNINVQEYLDAMGEAGERAVEMFSLAYERAYVHARTRGVLILDTKFEGLYAICDEALTPDSSRFTTAQDFQEAIAQGRDPLFHDKEFVRQWGRKVETPFFDEETGERITGINNLNPENPDHIAFVHARTVPKEIIDVTSQRCLEIFQMIVGCTLEEYKRDVMYV